MSQTSLPEQAWLAYEYDPGGQYLHLSQVFELKEEAERFCAQKNKELALECIMYCVCPVYFAPKDCWDTRRSKFRHLRMLLQDAHREIGRLYVLLGEKK